MSIAVPDAVRELLTSNADRESALEILAAHGKLLMHANEDLRSSKEAVLAAVRSSGGSLKYAAPSLKGDKEVVLAAVEKDPMALQYASQNLQEDKDVVLAAVQRDGSALWLAGDEICNDKEVVLAAARRCPDSFEVAGEDVQADPEVARIAVLQSSRMFRWASQELRSDRDFVKELICEQGKALEFASPELCKDPELILLAIRSGARSLFRCPQMSDICSSSDFKRAESSCLAAIGERGVHLLIDPQDLAAGASSSSSAEMSEASDTLQLQGIWGLDSSDYLTCTVPAAASVEEVAKSFRVAQEERAGEEVLPQQRKIVFRVVGRPAPVSPLEAQRPFRDFLAASDEAS